jgi:anti-sigma-K factor RskA
VGDVTTTVSASCGAALVQITNMEAPPPDHTYQVWVITGEQTRSVTTVTPDDTGTMPDVVTAVHVGDTAVGVTVEPAGGSPAPTTDPVIVVPLV